MYILHVTCTFTFKAFSRRCNPKQPTFVITKITIYRCRNDQVPSISVREASQTDLQTSTHHGVGVFCPSFIVPCSWRQSASEKDLWRHEKNRTWVQRRARSHTIWGRLAKTSDWHRLSLNDGIILITERKQHECYVQDHRRHTNTFKTKTRLNTEVYTLFILVYKLLLRLGSLSLCGGHVGSSISPECCCCFGLVSVSGRPGVSA